MRRLTRKYQWNRISGLAAAALLAGCANVAEIEPIEGRTFIVEDHERQAVWDAAVSALEDGGSLESSDFARGEMRGYSGVGLDKMAVLVTLSQLYPNEDVYTVSVASRSVAPLIDPEPAQDKLVASIQENLQK